MHRPIRVFARRLILTAGLLIVAGRAAPAAEPAVRFDAANGAIAVFGEQAQEHAVLTSGPAGLWEARFRGGRVLRAAEFSATSAEKRFACEPAKADGATTMIYQCADIDVTVHARPLANGVELSADVCPKREAVLEFALPGRLRFEPGEVVRLVCPANGNMSVGTAFERSFFERRPNDRPASWSSRSMGPKGYVSLYGGPLAQRPAGEALVALRVTDDGRTWLGGAARRLEGTTAVVDRPPAAGQADLVLVDSPHGPYFSASRLRGKGLLWRIGAGIHEAEQSPALEMVAAVISRLTATSVAPRKKFGLIALAGGPPQGSWAAIGVNQWAARLAQLPAVRTQHVELVPLQTVTELDAALSGDQFAGILNPYGELLPVDRDDRLLPTVEKIGRYVRAGGNWFEVGGYSFFAALRPATFYYQYGVTYPPAFADFLHLQTRTGAVAVYGVQPRTWQPWAAQKHPADVFIPGRLGCGGDEQGGWCERVFAPYVAAGKTWRSPPVRLTLGGTAADDLRAYAAANQLDGPLADKMPAERLARLKSAVLVYLGGTCREKLAHLSQLPQPTLIHFADYLRGGFDKQYPDHLPPSPAFGSPQEFRALFDEAHRLGHLVMPYTNPTWWCDGPRGETFIAQGDAPLLRTLDGALSPEKYSKNSGFTICYWHPAVQAANRRTVQQFTAQYPVDMLFQDQCGARTWHYDTNPASPSPDAYIEGLLSMVAEDSRRVPLSTEAGWDQVARYESQLCGMSWQLVPTQHAPAWRRLMKQQYDPATWTVFPVAQYLAHERAELVHHDLGQFVTNRQVLAWTLGLGFAMSDRIQAAALDNLPEREWLLWLDRLQKSIGARYVGVALAEFRHQRPTDPRGTDDGLIETRYGDVQIAANLGPRPKSCGVVRLAPFGFHATAPDLAAGCLARVGTVDFGDRGMSFVTQTAGAQTDVWVFAPAEQDVAVLLPRPLAAKSALRLDGHGELAIQADGAAVRFHLPSAPDAKPVEPPAELAGKAPRDWPGARPAVAVLDFGPNVTPSWSSIGPDRWLTALRESPLAKQHGLKIIPMTGVPQLAEALAAGPTHCLAIVNPYGERFPCAGPDQWRAMLDAISRYVEHGGSWWETGGYSFHQATWAKPGGWGVERIEGRGLAALRLPIGGGELDQPPEPLSAPTDGRAWLGDRLADRLAELPSTVNRGLPRGREDPGHLTLVAGSDADFIGGYRLNGWGWLWRVGGTRPNAEVTLPVALAAIEHLYTHPPQGRLPGGVDRLWHGTISSKE